MIQGYAIYLRTHRETGQQYAGAVWGSKEHWLAKKACLRRWKEEDKAGLAGVFGDFDSEIILVERRADAPAMSDGLYHIRIAVDEAKAIEEIPTLLCLNRVSPLLQLNSKWLNEEIHAIGRQKAGRHNASSGHMKRISALGRTPEHQRMAGLANVANGHLEKLNAATSQKERSRRGKLGGPASVAAKRAKGIPIFPVGLQRANGILTTHRRYHIAKRVLNPKCELCVPKG